MKLIRRITIVSLYLLVAVSITACRTTEYEIELQPDGGTMQRKVSMWARIVEDGVEAYGEFDEDELRYISQIYGLEMPVNLVQRHEFEGRFQARLPSDVTDGGWYLHQASLMGSVNSYVEHVGGGEKISWSLETRRTSLNRLVDVWLGWLDFEFGEDERYPPFREFVDFVIRDDLWNVALYLWSFDTFLLVGEEVSDEKELQISADFLVRVGVYLAERSYFDPEKVPEIVRRVLVSPEEEQGDVLLSFAMRGLATKLGTAPDEPLPWPMQAIIDDLDSYARSLERFVSDSDTIRELAETWEQEFLDSLSPSERAELEAFEQQAAEALREAGPEDVIVEEEFVTADGRRKNSVDLDLSASVLSQLFENAFGVDLDFFSSRSSRVLRVVLHLPQKPVVTNGTWEEDGTVRWRNSISSGGDLGDRLPDVFHAFWVQPAVEFQAKHFGKLVLNDEELLEHVGWYMALSPELAQEWNDFVTELEPGPELIETLQSFCFSPERATCAARSASDAPAYDEQNNEVLWVRPYLSDIAYSTVWDIVHALESTQEAGS
ncbi:MAG: hypothetical protein WBM57_00810, partial [Woeseiaceae bacterium]